MNKQVCTPAACLFPLRFGQGDFFMEEKRICVLSVIVKDRVAAERLNAHLSAYGEYVVGRMGIPYREKDVSVLCVVNALTGKIGQLDGVSAKTLFSQF